MTVTETPRRHPRKTLTVKVCGAHPRPRKPTDAVAKVAGSQRRASSSENSTAVPPKIDNVHTERTMSASEPNHRPAVNGHAPGTESLFPLPASPADATRNLGTRPSVPASHLAAAMDQAHENLLALERLAEQTAKLHRQFLEGQASTQKTLQSLLEHQQRLAMNALGRSRDMAAPETEPRAVRRLCRRRRLPCRIRPQASRSGRRDDPNRL